MSNLEHSINPSIDQQNYLNDGFTFNLSIFEEEENDLQLNDKNNLKEHPRDVNNYENEVSCTHEQLENQCDNDNPLSFESLYLFNDDDECHLGSDDNDFFYFTSSSDDEGLNDDNKDFDECLDPSRGCVVAESFEPISISFKTLVDDDLVDDFKIIDFHDPCEEGY